MSSEEGASQLDGSESPEIISCSLSCSTEALPSPPKESLASLLLQIQQYHSAETDRLQEQVNRFKMKCNKLAKVSNDNAAIAKQYSKKNKILRAQVIKLERKLQMLQSSRQDGLDNISKIQAEQASQSRDTKQAQSSPSKDPPAKLFRVPSKLSCKKSNKKVRYAEVPATQGFPKPSTKTLQQRNSNVELRPNAVPDRPIVSEKTLASHDITQAVGSPCSIILAPDTCASPSVQPTSNPRNPDLGATLGRHGTYKLMPDGPGTRIMDKSVHIIPETLGVESDDVASVAMGEECFLDTLAYASTPVASHSQVSLLSESESILFQALSQSPDSTRMTLSSAKTSSNPASRRAPLSVSIPRSESQFPVDLSSTQAKSPTFYGGGLATPSNPSGKSQQQGTTVDRDMSITPHRGDVTDESYQSEDSFLLLGPQVPKRVADHRFSNQPGQMTSKKAADSRQTMDKEPQGKASSHNTANATILRGSVNTRALAVKEEYMPKKPHLNLSKLPQSKKRKLDHEESAMDDDTVLPEEQCLGKENSPEGLKDIHQTDIPQSKGGNYLSCDKTGSKVQAKGSRNFKQSKLILNKTKPATNKSASLMREYNGGSLVNADSQTDAFMKQAIELSLINQKHTEVTREDKLRPGNIEDGFKVPNMPCEKQQCSVTLKVVSTKKASQQDRSDHEDSDLHESLSSPQDLNGSVDPLMDLTKLETESSQSSSNANRSIIGEEQVERSLEADLEGDDDEVMFSEREDDSCQDLFEDEDDEPGENLDDSAVGPEASFIKNFDFVPKVDDKPNYKYAEVVRKHDERQKLKGFGCQECQVFYGDLSLTDSQLEKRMKMCSRHRAQFSPPSTPAHYWSIGFPDTQTCLQRGYIKQSTSPDRHSKLRKKNKYKKLFSGKEADDTRQEVVEER